MNTAPVATWMASVADTLDEAVWIWDAADGHVLFTNAAFQRQYAAVAGESGLGTAVLLSHVASPDVVHVRAARAVLPAHGYTVDYALLLPVAGSTPRALRLQERALVTPGPDGRPQVTHLLRDLSSPPDSGARLRAEIDRRADAERSRDDATQRLQALIASADDAVVSIDEASLVLDWNAAAERMFGWSRQEALGQVLTQMIVPAVHRGHHHGGIERYLRDGSSTLFGRRVETQALRRNGDTFHVELSVWPVRAGASHTFSSFIRDISQRKAAERALAESEAKYRKVVENVSEGILVTAGGRILYANRKALALTGMDTQDALARPFIEFIHPDDRERVLGNHIRRLRGESVENNYQFRVLHRAGGVRWLEISGVVFEWQDAPATLNFLTDITERRQAEEEIRGALARERELSEMKSRFVAVASHEFRTPLAAILSSIELLDDYGPRLQPHERSEIVGLVKDAVARMNGMVEQVLLTSRLEAGQFPFAPQPVTAAALLVQLAGELEQAHPQARRIALRCEDGDLARRLDARLVRHVLVNLLNNALKYSPPDSPVDCALRGDGELLLLEISDQGIGIPPQDVPRLFERFHRGTNVGNIPGTGIGLHVVRECVQLHGGSIEVDSAPGRGTTFRVRLHAPTA